MTAISIFDEMTTAADAMRATVTRLNRGDLQIEFRQIVLAGQPDLSRQEWLELFDVWMEDYVGKCELQREEAFTHIVATSEEFARASVPAEPFASQAAARLSTSPGSRSSAP